MTLHLDRSPEEITQIIEQEDKRSRHSDFFVGTGCAAIFLVFAAVVLLGLLYGCYRIYEARQGERRLETHGVKTTGKKESVTTYLSLLLGDSYLLRYTFTVDSKTYQGTSALDKDPSYSAITVVYDPDDPTTNRVEGDLGMAGPFASRRIWIWFITAVLVLAVLSILKDAAGRLFTRKDRSPPQSSEN
jgi:hypothetical protein